MTAPEYGSADWAMRYARDYRNETQAKDALRALADEVIELRAGNRLLRELVEPVAARAPRHLPAGADGRHGRRGCVVTDAERIAGLIKAYDAEVIAHGQTQRDNDLLFSRLDYLLKQYDRLVQAHDLVVMDTPEDRELHGRVVAEFRKAADPVRKLIAERDGEVQAS